MSSTSRQQWHYSSFGIPSAKGVYCVIVCNIKNKQSKVLYIGSSKNMYKRVMASTHPYRILLDQYSYPEMVVTKTKICDNYLELERKLITKLNPPFNKQHIHRTTI